MLVVPTSYSNLPIEWTSVEKNHAVCLCSQPVQSSSDFVHYRAPSNSSQVFVLVISSSRHNIPGAIDPADQLNGSVRNVNDSSPCY